MSYNGLVTLQHFPTTAVSGTPADTKSVTATTTGNTTTTTTTTTAAKAVGEDQAKLSVSGSLISLAVNSSSVRAEKIAALQASIASGSYQVSSLDLADRLIVALLS